MNVRHATLPKPPSHGRWGRRAGRHHLSQKLHLSVHSLPAVRWLEIPPLREGWHSRAGKWPRLMKNKAPSDGRSFTVAHMLLLCRSNGGLRKCGIGTEPKTHKTKHGRQTWTRQAAVYSPWLTAVPLITATSVQNMFASKHKAWCWTNYTVFVGSEDSGLNCVVFAVLKRNCKNNNSFSQFVALCDHIRVQGSAGIKPTM